MESVSAACEKGSEAGINRAAEQMGEKGLRTLAYGYRVTDVLPAPLEANQIERHLKIGGLVGMMDPPRPEAAQAIRDCKTAGIVPVMMTGDHPVTAKTIAHQLGIINSADESVGHRDRLVADVRGRIGGEN